MKKVIFSAIIAVIMLCSCKGASTAPPVTTFESAKVYIKSSDMVLEGTASRSGKNMWSFVFGAPENISGMTITKKGGAFETTFMGLTRTYEESPLEEAGALSDFFETLDCIEEITNINPEPDGNSYYFEFSDDDYTYEITADCKTGAISGIYCSGYEAAFTY